MPVSPDFRAEVERRLSAVGPVKLRPMFGGIGIYSGSTFFAVVDDDILYFKVDSSNREDFVSAGMAQFAPMGPDKPMQYYRVPDEVLADDKLLREWMNKAVAAGRRASARRDRTSHRRKKKP